MKAGHEGGTKTVLFVSCQGAAVRHPGASWDRRSGFYSISTEPRWMTGRRT